MPFTFRQGDLPKLDLQVDRGTDFAAWKQQWDSYVSLSGLAGEDATKQVQALTLCFSRETLTIVQNLGLSEDEQKSVDSIIRAIKRYIDGHINESVERRNFRRRTQQPGEPFDDFLVSLRELVKTCNFCSEACTQKNIRDQIIEGLLDGDTIETLLQETNLTLATTISKCQAQEAAKRQRANLTSQPSESIAALQRPRDKRIQASSPMSCPGCGGSIHPAGRSRCPAYGQVCFHCQKLGHFAKVCRSKSTRRQPHLTPTPTSTNLPNVKYLTISGIRHIKANEPAPLIEVLITSPNGSSKFKVLPDSGADISAAGKEVLHNLNEHVDNLTPSSIIPKAVNGTDMYPLGKLPVKFKLGSHEHNDELHIYPDISGALLSWKACKGLGILPDCYPHPISQTQHLVKRLNPTITDDNISLPLTIDKVIKEFPTVFDEHVRTMTGEEFHISLTANAKPFCVNTPRSIPFIYRDKLKAELESLQKQGIIAPITEATEWCAPIVVTPKKNSDNIRLCGSFTSEPVCTAGTLPIHHPCRSYCRHCFVQC